ncbi:MAG: hypothetical protein HY905_25600 [Deltaproteobacteria bacterium]|nr:hypothetical protein [Deltaproteobacteria bacterium]
MNDFFRDLRQRVRRTMSGDDAELLRLARAAFERQGRASSLERVLVAATGLSAAAVGLALATTSILGLALAALILYVVLTRVFGFDLRLDPATLFQAMGIPQPKTADQERA